MNDAQMIEMYQTAHTIAVVGLSTNPARPGYYVPQYMAGKGYRVIPVNPMIQEALGQKAYADLLAVPEKVDVVHIFRPPQDAPAIVEQAIKIGAKYIWMQFGATNKEAAQAAEAAGLLVATDKCMMVEHKRLLGAR
jgi:predicted CoA-binding protein